MVDCDMGILYQGVSKAFLLWAFYGATCASKRNVSVCARIFLSPATYSPPVQLCVVCSCFDQRVVDLWKAPRHLLDTMYACGARENERRGGGHR